jgi:hypothetical protein
MPGVENSAMERGIFKFEVSDAGDLINNAANVERLRRLWLDRHVIDGADLGPGDPGDFDHGAWHVSCHIAGGCGVKQLADESLAWLQISHDGRVDRYFASVTVLEGQNNRTVPIDSAEGIMLLQNSKLLGFVEGTSLGRTSARFTTDAPTLFNLWRRQDFDQPSGSTLDGGRVWEHWCTLRDIRPPHAIGTSVLTAFVSLVAALGDRFIPTVARGRREYGHPVQLRAMISAGLVGRESALWDHTPTAIPHYCERVLEDADPETSLKAITTLDWSNPPRYYMFERKIKGWSKAADVKQDLAEGG